MFQWLNGVVQLMWLNGSDERNGQSSSDSGKGYML